MPWNDDALAEEDTLREADGEPDTLGAPRPPVVEAVAEEVSPAGDGAGLGVCRAKAVTAMPAAAAAATNPMTNASTSGRQKRRGGWFLPSGGG